jgi:octaprenyl-diphosphate synthase
MEQDRRIPLLIKPPSDCKGRILVDLKQISKPIQTELRIFSSHFKKELRSQVGIVDTVARYIVRQKGKRIRPALVFLSARLTGTINKRTYRAATLVEILHTATLVHDDVVDQSDTRRGFPSINRIWKNKIAVLMGDYFLSRGLLIALEKDEFYFLKIISDSVKRMSEGELLQIQKSRSFDITENTYYRIISDKTASLISTCCELGASSVTDDREHWNRLRTYGENLGMAFQIRDDMLDYIGRSSVIGKPTGIDMKEKKFTLPLIYSLARTERKTNRKIIKIIKNGASRKEIDYVIEFVNEYGGLEYTERKAQEFSQYALDAISGYPESPTKDSLSDLATFAITRTK